MTKRSTKPSEICKPAKKKTGGCDPRDDEGLLDSYSAIVRDYRRRCQPSADDILAFYQQLPTIEEAIKKAAFAELPSGKRHPHQYRLEKANLKKVRYRLRNYDLASCETFHDLFEMVDEAIGGIKGIGELMVYDTAHRLGAFLGLEPERVYLHAGVRMGAVALGFEKSRKWIEPGELPKAFRRLSAQQIEDCLCIYKWDLQEIER